VRTLTFLLVALLASNLSGQPLSTRCQAEEVRVATSTTDLRLIGCGEGFSDNLLWHLDRADSLDGSLDSKTNRKATGKGAVVYMCDTGVMRDHDEFTRAEGSVIIGAITAGGLGTDCPAGRNPALDPCYATDGTLAIFTHGTSTASIVAGRNTGVAPDAKIVSVYMETVGPNINLWIKTFEEIIRHAFDPGTPQFKTGIINMSFSVNYASRNDPAFPLFEKKMREMIAGVDQNGNADPAGKRFLFVTIAGNHIDGAGDQCDTSRNPNLYPAVLGGFIDGLITVGGIDESNHLWDRSCRGDSVDILAPAADMLVASISGRDHYVSGRFSPGEYPRNSGTSYAAPYVAGLAALLLEKDPNLTPVDLERIIKSTASRVVNLDEATAGGRVAVFDMISSIPRRRAARP
jgi:subtilisin family serine protease